MSLISEPQRNWVIPPFLLVVASAFGIVYDFISFYYHGLFWIVGSIITLCVVFAVIFSIVNSIVMLRNYLGEKEHFKWWRVILNLLPLLLIAYYLLHVILH